LFWTAGLLIIVFLFFRIMDITGWMEKDMFLVGKPLREIALPFQHFASVFGKAVGNLGDYISDNETLREENAQLRDQYTQLQSQLSEFREVRAENIRLQSLLDYKISRIENYDLVVAQVVARNPGNWYQTMVVNRGSNDGVACDMSVVNSTGLVGRIVSVTPNSAEVLLLLSNDAAVGSRIFETRLTTGVVVGTGDSGTLQMIHLPHDMEIEPGQTVISSGLGDIYPKSLPIGVVQEIVMDPNGLTKQAIVTPFVDFSRLEEIMIIRNIWKIEDPDPEPEPEPDAEGSDSVVPEAAP
jgi:rod shape-determining protein MreC